MKQFFIIIIAGLMLSACSSKDYLVKIDTPYGTMYAILYDATPQHKENFLKLASEKRYDSTIFHRVIKDFMIQGGDINQKKGVQDKIDYTIPAEFDARFIHEKGALAAARMGDQVNPAKASSGCQFYIVQGQKFNESILNEMVNSQYMGQLRSYFSQLLNKPEYAALRGEVIQMQQSGNFKGIEEKMMASKDIIEKEFGPVHKMELSPEQTEAYKTHGGAPHLDGAYTVFGKVISGLSVIDSIANVATAPGDKPVEDIYIQVSIEEMSRKQITKQFGYVYPAEEDK